MADEHNRWLNRRTAERLLHGESLEAVDSAARDRAERLSEALGALAAEATGHGTELPGEEAALAAFRKARDTREDAAAQADAAQAGAGHKPGVPDDAGLVRIGARPHAVRRPGWVRPVRLALTAALAAGALGGVAMAAGSGVLPTPFGGHTPGTGTSVSSAPAPGQPADPPSPEGTPGGPTALLPPSGGATSAPSSPGADPGGGAGRGATGTPGASPDAGTAWGAVLSACRDIRAGKELAPGRRSALDGVAGGSARVWKYCKGVLGTSGNATGDEDGHGADGGNGKGHRDGEGGRKGNGGQDGDGRGGRDGDGDGHGGRDGDGDGHGGRGGGRHHRDGRRGAPTPSSFTPFAPKRTATTPAPSPSPTYTAL